METLALRIDTRTVTAFANYGVSDRVDIGAALPIVSMELAGERINTYRGQTIPQAAQRPRRPASPTWRLPRERTCSESRQRLTAGAELRLPTGREEDLLGTGEPALRLLAIGSIEGTRASAHVNGGYSWGGISREATYSAALTVAASERFTLVGEFLGRWVEALGEIGQVTAPHPTSSGVDTIRLLPIGRARSPEWRSRDSSGTSVAAGSSTPTS